MSPSNQPAVATDWPGRSVRRAALAIAAVCTVALITLANLMDGGADSMRQVHTKAYELGPLRFALPSLAGRSNAGVPSPLVIFGDPRVFVASLMALGAWAWRAGDRRLLMFSVLGPLAAEGICQLVAKPTFFATVGGQYGYPSGHTTGATCLAIAAFVTVRRLKGQRASRLFAPIGLVISSMTAAGVVMSGMHPLKDAYGALFFSTAVMGTAIYFLGRVQRA